MSDAIDIECVNVPATRIACLGECMVELVERPDGLLSRGFGGDTLNTAIYLARLRVTVDYVTALGSDPFSDDMLRAWQREGVGTAFVLRCEDALPGLYLIQTDDSGERRFFYWRDSAPARRLLTLPGMDQIERGLARHDMVYLSGITLSLFDPPSRTRLFRLLDALRTAGCRVAFDTNFRARGWPDAALARAAYQAMLSRADLVLASVEDLVLLDGPGEPDALIARLGASASEIVLKLPEPGCLVTAAGIDRVHVPGLPAQVVDTTAAGDSFAAAYIAARVSGSAPPDAAREGHKLAAAVVGHRGAILPHDAMPSRQPATLSGPQD